MLPRERTKFDTLPESSRFIVASNAALAMDFVGLSARERTVNKSDVYALIDNDEQKIIIPKDLRRYSR
jgi:hypothetical protein